MIEMMDKDGFKAACKLLNIKPYRHPYFVSINSSYKLKIHYGKWFAGVYYEPNDGLIIKCDTIPYNVFLDMIITNLKHITTNTQT